MELSPRRSLVALACCAALATSGCAGASPQTRGTGLVVGGLVVGALGAVTLTATSDCSGNSEAPNACTFGDHAQDLGATVGGALIVGAGVAAIIAGVYLLSR